MEDEKINIILYTKHIGKLNRSEKLKKALKLQCHFVHASKEKLLKLVKESTGFDDKESTKCI